MRRGGLCGSVKGIENGPGYRLVQRRSTNAGVLVRGEAVLPGVIKLRPEHIAKA